MKLPVTLQSDIIEFLKSLPNINDNGNQRVFIYSAGLDSELENQIQYIGSLTQFITLLVATLSKYGKLHDGRYALEAILESTKNYIGEDRRAYCDRLIVELHNLYRDEVVAVPSQIKAAKPVLSIIRKKYFRTLLITSMLSTMILVFVGGLKFEIKRLEEATEFIRNKPEYRFVTKKDITLDDSRYDIGGTIYKSVLLYSDQNLMTTNTSHNVMIYGWIWAESVRNQDGILILQLDENIRDRINGTLLGQMRKGTVLKKEYSANYGKWYLFSKNFQINSEDIQLFNISTSKKSGDIIPPIIMTLTTPEESYETISFLLPNFHNIPKWTILAIVCCTVVFVGILLKLKI